MRKPVPLSVLAGRFGQSPGWMRDNLDRLQQEHGFPKTIAGFPEIFDMQAIEDWLAAQRAPAPSGAQRVEGSDQAPNIDWDIILDRRALALALPRGEKVMNGKPPQVVTPETDELTQDFMAAHRFGYLMFQKLEQKSREGRSGWRLVPVDTLWEMLRQHVEKGDPVDVANFAMMIHFNSETRNKG